MGPIIAGEIAAMHVARQRPGGKELLE